MSKEAVPSVWRALRERWVRRRGGGEEGEGEEEGEEEGEGEGEEMVWRWDSKVSRRGRRERIS